MAVISFPIVFLLSVLITSSIYAWAKRVAPGLKAVGGKLKTYACGEDMETIEPQYFTDLFYYTAIFAVFDIIAFILITGWTADFSSIAVYIIATFVAIIGFGGRR